MGNSSRPVLWHIPISHYNEKVRWALDLKGVEHDRKAPNPHPPTAALLTRGKHATLPIMRIDGEIVHDSTTILAKIDERWPEPPLYPSDPADRQRALDIEDWFDEQAAPHVRLLVWHETVRDRDSLDSFVARYSPGPLGRVRPVAGAMVKSFVAVRYRVSDKDRAAAARERVLAAFDHLEEELGDGDYLVGDEFTVADLTAASILYPLVTPPEGPEIATPPAIEELRAPLRDRRAYRWIEETYRRHRNQGGASRGQAAASTTAPGSA